MTVEEYIKAYTKTCSNEHCMTVQRAQDLKPIVAIEPFYEPWLTPDHARAVAQIAREEVIEKAVAWIKEHKEAVETEDNGIMGWIPDYFIEDFKKALEEE